MKDRQKQGTTALEGEERQKFEISRNQRPKALYRISQRQIGNIDGFPSSEEIIREDRNR